LCVLIFPMIAWPIPTLAFDAIYIVIGCVKLSEDFRLSQAPWEIFKKAAS